MSVGQGVGEVRTHRGVRGGLRGARSPFSRSDMPWGRRSLRTKADPLRGELACAASGAAPQNRIAGFVGAWRFAMILRILVIRTDCPTVRLEGS